LKQSQKHYKRIVVKIGSSLFCSDSRLDCALVDGLAGQISSLMKQGKEVIVVSSGAIALGMSVLKLNSRPKELAHLQAAAAVGQHELMDVYRRAFKAEQLNCAQVLLTWEDFDEHSRYLNAKNTLSALLKLKAVPVINENDTISTEEIKFGDNDRLSALLATLVGADLLVILSDVDGLLDSANRVVRVVDEITPAIYDLVCPTKKKTCVGGMFTKLEAGKIAVSSGIPCVIANGKKKDALALCVNDPFSCGTIFIPKAKLLAAKERWIAFSARTKGKIIVDAGAKAALMNKKSLLSVGVRSIEGDFSIGDIVSLVDLIGSEFARGKTRLSSRELNETKGSRSDKEVIHCDNIVIV
jgi:glutamate 5-kinase